VTSSTGIGGTIRTTLIVGSLAVGGLAAIATIVGFFGSFWWGFDLMTNFRWQIAWVSLASAVIYALSARGVASLVFVVMVLVNGFVIAPAWTGSQPAGTGEDGVRIVSLDMSDTSDLEESLRRLFDSGADLLIVSGVTSDRVEPLIAEGSPYVPLRAPAAQRTGITILGQQDFTVTSLPTGTSGEPVEVVLVPSGDDVISVVTAWGQIADSSLEADELSARLDTIRTVVDNRTGPVMVVGNLGATVYTAGMRNLIGDTALRDATEGFGYSSTWPVWDVPIIGGWVGIPIDVVLMTPDITPFEFTTGPDIAAGHLPITVIVGPSLGF
jgi:hypothetical protein